MSFDVGKRVTITNGTISDGVTYQFTRGVDGSPDVVTGVVVYNCEYRKEGGYGVLVQLDAEYVNRDEHALWVDGISGTEYDWAFTADGRYVEEQPVVLGITE